MIQSDYPERVYAGLLGKCIGVRLGAPVEPTVWSYERILETYGDISGYVKDYKNFAADDDVNGPLFFIRALYDYGTEREITAEDIGNCWLNYTREGKGFLLVGGLRPQYRTHGIPELETWYPGPFFRLAGTQWRHCCRTDRRSNFHRLLGTDFPR